MAGLKTLFTPIKIGSLKLPNRIIMSAITTLFDFEESSRWLDFYVERAKGGAGLLIVGGLQTLFPGRESRLGKVHLYSDRNIAKLTELTEAVHLNRGIVAAQLATHNYWAKNGKMSAAEYIGPSEVDIPTAGLHPNYCQCELLPKVRSLTVDEIIMIEEAIGDAAVRAQQAGFDAVELLVAAGNLLNRFLNPCTNRRTDEYGGSLENRTRIVLRAINNIKKKVGEDFPLICRISGLDMVPWGLELDSWQQIASLLEKAGSHALSIYPGWHDTRQSRHQMSVPRGNFVYLAQAIKEVVGIPVAANIRINDPLLADQIIAEGRADLIAMGTPLIADPYLPRKAMEDRLEDIRMCGACCNCWDLLVNGEPIDCTVNASVGREAQYPIVPAAKSKKVYVIGGGPGGMEAARVAALRGHRVRLFEQKSKLGGQLSYATLPPHKDEWKNLVRYLSTQLKKLAVDIRLNDECTAARIEKDKPDAVIIATGAAPIIPDIPGTTGKDYIINETVDVGQDEVDVVRTAHSTVIVVVPGMGDEIQAIKAGILETGDIFVINKADHQGADKTLGDLRLMIDMNPKKYEQGNWKPPVLKTEALFDNGVTDILKQIGNHAAYLKKSTGATPFRRRKEKVEQELTEMVKSRLVQEVFQQLAQTGAFDEAVESIVNGKMDPYTACDTLILPKLGLSNR